MTPDALCWPRSWPTLGGVRLRAFGPDDVDAVRDLATDPYVPLVGSLEARASPQQAREWIARQHHRLVSGTGWSFCVADVADDRALGAAGLTLSAPTQGRASVGYAVAPRERGRGIAAQALTALAAFAWTQPGLHRLEAYVEPWNAASLRTATRAGFAREGLLRSHQEIGGRRVDMVLLAALRPTTRSTP